MDEPPPMVPDRRRRFVVRLGSAVGLDRSFDDFGLLSQQFRHMRSHELGGDRHRLVRTLLVLEDAERRALTVPGVQPVVLAKALGLAEEGHELVLDEAIDLGAVLLVEVVMADDGEHWASFREVSWSTGQLIVSLGGSRARPSTAPLRAKHSGGRGSS